MRPAQPLPTPTSSRLRVDWSRGSTMRVALAVSLALMGDALLYAILPTQAVALGIPLASVGVLLSANRLIRLLTNSWAASLYQRHGRARPFFLAVVVASFTTFAYGLPGGFVAFLPARILWGTCWSFLNLGMYLAVLEQTAEHERGKWLGMTKAVSRFGTIAAVAIGGYLTDAIGFRTVVWLLSLLGLVGAWLARPGWRTGPEAAADEPQSVGPLSHGSSVKPEPRLGSSPGNDVPPRLLYTLGFVNGFVSSGVIMGTLALLLVQRFGESVGIFGLTVGVATLSGLFSAKRWFIQTVLAPVSGHLGDRYGARRVLPIAVLLQATTLTALGFIRDPIALAATGAVLFMGGIGFAVSLDAVVSRVAVQQRQVQGVMSRYVTAADLGSAVGPLVGYLVGLGLGLPGLYVGASLLSLGMGIWFVMASRRGG